tara:strand:- start:1930 stop:2595 length:666 start_codon:yes stop_codon:yes gene_type:complete
MRLLVCSSRNWFKLNGEISKNNIVKFITGDEELTLDSVDQFKPDYILFPHWNWIVKKDIHENYDCIVFHTAPLPYGRGGSPIQNLIMEGFQTSPVCAIKMTDKLDAGPIYSSSNISLEGNLDSIFLRINDTVNKLIAKIISENPQPMAQVGEPHIFKRLTQSNNEIAVGLDLDKIYDHIRMVDHVDYQNAFIMYGDIKIEFENASHDGNTIEATCRITKFK